MPAAKIGAVKVVYLADAPYPHTGRWVEHFAGRGITCEVISFRPAQIAGARVHYVGGGERLGKLRYLVHARRVARLIRQLQPDLVHALHLTSYGFLGALAAVRPLVISVWGTDILEAPRLTPLHARLTRYALARADCITATGLHLATETTLYAPRGVPVTVVPYGVDLERFSPASHPPRTELVVGAVSRLSPEKGLTYLLEAFALVCSSMPGSRLRIAGEGPELAKLEAQVKRLQLKDRVELCGWLGHDEVPAFLRDLDLFVLPSTFEGFGVAAAEASAAGLAVVASDVHGIPDVVRNGRTGLLVPPRDSAALAEAIASLLLDPEQRSRLGAAGREYVASKYDWRRNVLQMEAIYEGLVARRREEVVV